MSMERLLIGDKLYARCMQAGASILGENDLGGLTTYRRETQTKNFLDT